MSLVFGNFHPDILELLKLIFSLLSKLDSFFKEQFIFLSSVLFFLPSWTLRSYYLHHSFDNSITYCSGTAWVLLLNFLYA